MKHRNKPHPRKPEALRLLAEGMAPFEVARCLDLQASTVRMWKTREKAKVPASGAPGGSRPVGDVLGLGEFELRVLGRARSAVETGIRRLEQLLPDAKGVQSVAISTGILLDKVAKLDELIAAAQEREIRISEAQADLVAAVLRAFLQAVGLSPDSESITAVLAVLLKQAGAGEALLAPPVLVAAAREEIAAQFRGARPGLLALPPPAPEVEIVVDAEVVA